MLERLEAEVGETQTAESQGPQQRPSNHAPGRFAATQDGKWARFLLRGRPWSAGRPYSRPRRFLPRLRAAIGVTFRPGMTPPLWGKMECSSFLVLLVLRGCHAGPSGLNTYAVRRLRGGSLKVLLTVLLAYDRRANHENVVSPGTDLTTHSFSTRWPPTCAGCHSNKSCRNSCRLSRQSTALGPAECRGQRSKAQ